MWKREIIRIPVKAVITIIIIFIIFFSVVIVIGNKKAGNYIEATLTTEISLTQITGNEGYSYLRGAVFYDRNSYINTSARLIGNDSLSKDIWKSNGPIIDFDATPHEFTLDDLEMPYLLYKKKNSDTINVIKDGFEIKFLILGSRK
jgi:hypothetical protein